jgi:hypothetical protein
MYKFEYPAHNDPNKAIYSTEPPNTNVISARWRPIKNIVVRENPQIMYVDPGTAHSEYLLALSERGVPALAVFLSLMLLVLIRTVQMCRTFDRMAPKVEVLLISLPILAFGVHAIFNNFLDDCKIAFPFYAFVALFVQMDHTHKGANGRPPIKRPTDSGNVAH